MKRITRLFFLACVLISCNQKNTPEDIARIKCPETVKKFEDPQRIYTCERFINCIKQNDMRNAIKLTDMDHYLDPDMSMKYMEENLELIKNIKTALDRYNIVPKEQWIIKYDTAHVKINTGGILTPFISILEYINIPIDRGSEPIDSQICINVAFNVTALDADPEIIAGANLARLQYFNNKPTNHNLKYPQ